MHIHPPAVYNAVGVNTYCGSVQQWDAYYALLGHIDVTECCGGACGVLRDDDFGTVRVSDLQASGLRLPSLVSPRFVSKVGRLVESAVKVGEYSRVGGAGCVASDGNDFGSGIRTSGNRACVVDSLPSDADGLGGRSDSSPGACVGDGGVACAREPLLSEVENDVRGPNWARNRNNRIAQRERKRVRKASGVDVRPRYGHRTGDVHKGVVDDDVKMGFWNSCSEEVRKQLVDSKAKMHIARNLEEVRKCEAAIEREQSPETVLRKLFAMTALQDKVKDVHNEKVANWAANVASGRVETIASSAPSTLPSYKELSEKLAASSESSFELTLKSKDDEIAELSEKVDGLSTSLAVKEKELSRFRDAIVGFGEKAKVHAANGTVVIERSYDRVLASSAPTKAELLRCERSKRAHYADVSDSIPEVFRNRSYNLFH